MVTGGKCSKVTLNGFMSIGDAGNAAEKASGCRAEYQEVEAGDEGEGKEVLHKI